MASVDILINNAGITKDNILPQVLKEEEWATDVIQTNLTGSLFAPLNEQLNNYDEK